MHHPTDRRAYTTAFVTPTVEHWMEQGIPHEGQTEVTNVLNKCIIV